MFHSIIALRFLPLLGTSLGVLNATHLFKGKFMFQIVWRGFKTHPTMKTPSLQVGWAPTEQHVVTSSPRNPRTAGSRHPARKPPWPGADNSLASETSPGICLHSAIF